MSTIGIKPSGTQYAASNHSISLSVFSSHLKFYTFDFCRKKNSEKMAKILSIAVALAAVLFVAYALPRPEGEELPAPEPPAEGGAEGGEGGEAAEGGEATSSENPCAQFQEQCSNNGGQVDNGGGGQGNMTQGNTMPPMSPQCQALQQQCGNQNNLPVTAPPGQTMPGGMTQPTQPGMTQPTQPSMNNMTTPAPEMPSQNSTIPGLGLGAGRR